MPVFLGAWTVVKKHEGLGKSEGWEPVKERESENRDKIGFIFTDFHLGVWGRKFIWDGMELGLVGTWKGDCSESRHGN